MTLEEILQSIKDGCTGDSEKDQIYLKEQMEKYKDHEYKDEIVRECGRLLYDCLDDKQKNEFEKSIDQDREQMQSAIKEVDYFLSKKEYEKAKDIIEPIIKGMKQETLFKSDSKNVYYSFNEPFEDILFQYLEKPEQEVQRAPVPYSDAYYAYARVLMELNEIDQAKDALKSAIQWNPTSSKIQLLYIETMKEDLDRYFEFTKFLFQYIFHVEDLAKAYCNLAWYFDQKDLKRIAYGCYGISLNYKEIQEAYDYMNNLDQKDWFQEPSMGEMVDFGEKYGFPIGPNQDVVGLAYGYGKQCFNDNMREPALYFLGIAYALSGQQDIADLLEQLESK
jgi:tetratricopeptide (TPR) repeat protein